MEVSARLPSRPVSYPFTLFWSAVFIYRELSLADLVNVAYESAIGTAQVMIILAGASVFSWLLTRLQVPAALANMLSSIAHSKVMVLLLINVILLIAGMFLDAASIQTIMSPLFLPAAVQFKATQIGRASCRERV